MANPTAKTAGSEIMDFKGLALRVGQIQNEDGAVVLDGTASQQSTIADLAVTDVDALFGAIKVVSASVDASAGGTAQTTALFTIPANSLLLSVHAAVDTVFDGDTTTTLEVGVSGNIDAYIDTDEFDVTGASEEESNFSSGTADINDIEYSKTARALIATWTNTANATTGAVTVTAHYIEMADADLSTELAAAFAEIESKINTILAALEDAGILADS